MELKSPKPGALLAKINSPADLKKLPPEKLTQVCHELREFIIDMVSIYGGHFGAGLGVVELTTALHYVFNTPEDIIIWDVGHQAYSHKILTGRRDVFHTNRKLNGISGFPKRSESKYDAFGVGHSSTSISAALGMAAARQLDGSDRKIVVVIGDGAMTAGLAYEALNNIVATTDDILIILNDNNISIDQNVGALKNHLSELVEKSQKRPSNQIKSEFFEIFGLDYHGPVDGNDVYGLIDKLGELKSRKGTDLLHITTVKGKGFAPAEKNQTEWHSSGGAFDKITGASLKAKQPNGLPRYQDVFGDTLVELAQNDENIVAITPAMPSGSGLLDFMRKFPERFYDVGIAEQHAVTFSAGLAAKGKTPFCAIYSTFLQRAYDQLIHDVCIQNLPVVFCIDRAGLVGADGPTHHGVYDIAYLQSIPNLIISSPLNAQDLQNMMFTASKNKSGAWAIRYPRGKAVEVSDKTDFELVEIGKGVCLNEGDEIAILSLGPIGQNAIKAVEEMAQEGIEVAHYDMRFAKPLDYALLDLIAERYEYIITLEDGAVYGGFGSAVAAYLMGKSKKLVIKQLGVKDEVVEQGTQQELYRLMGMDTQGIIKTIRECT